MRTKKAGINITVNFITYMVSFLPIFIVRKVFLNNLGENLLGLSSLYSNIVGLLAIVEMGIGTAIIFALYKPFAENDRRKVKGYLNYYNRFYKRIGFIILICGLLIAPFLKIFIKGEIDIRIAIWYFILFLLNTFISYMFSYKISMLYVSQQGYLVSIGTTISKITIAILQIILLKITQSFSAYLVVQLLVNLMYYFFINNIINKKFNWINKINGELDIDDKNKLSKNIKALFIHKFGGLLVLSTDNLIISSFINLSTVSKFNSYYLVVSSVQNLIVTGFSSITSSIGNLLTENNKEKSFEIHKRLFFVNFWIGSFVVISLYNTINQFIILWLGESQILDSFTVSIILINVYFMLMRSSVDIFKEAGGIYHEDRYASLIEAAVNLIFSIILVNVIGLPGVFLGTLISNFTVLFWVKPRMVYKYVFCKPIINYYIAYFKYLIIAIFTLIITSLITRKISEIHTINAFLINCVLNIVLINIIYIMLLFKNDNFIYFKEMCFDTVSSIFRKKRNQK